MDAKLDLSQDDIKSIVRSKNFQEFFDKTTKMIERVFEIIIMNKIYFF